MYIEKGQTIFDTWFNGKHIQTFHLSLISGGAQIKWKILSKSFSMMHKIWGDNTEYMSEYSNKSVKG